MINHPIVDKFSKHFRLLNFFLTSSLQDSWTVQVKQNTSSRSKSDGTDVVSRNSIQRADSDPDSKIENIIFLHDKVTSMPGMVENEKTINDFDNLDIDEVELVAESDEYDYDDFNDRLSVGTPSLPSLSLSSSEDSVNYEFDQSSQSDFSALAYKRSKLPLQNSTGITHLPILFIFQHLNSYYTDISYFVSQMF